MKMSGGKFYTGTSNGHMPGNKLTFPPAFRQKSRLNYYSTLFNTIEVNSSFYKRLLYSTYNKWANDVPLDFRFSLKLSKEITHAKELKSDLSIIDTFLQAAAGIGNKKGCLLIQFPGKINLNYFNRVEQILKHFNVHDPEQTWRKAIEFRNESWYIGETTELLNEFNVAMVMHDFSKAKVLTDPGSVDFAYMRFHGPSGNYRDSYSTQALDEKAEVINEMLKSGKDVYSYFNNTMGNAFENALYLKSKIHSYLFRKE